MEASSLGFFREVVTDQKRLASADHMFDKMIASAPRVFVAVFAVTIFKLETYILRLWVKEGDEEAFHV